MLFRINLLYRHIHWVGDMSLLTQNYKSSKKRKLFATRFWEVYHDFACPSCRAWCVLCSWAAHSTPVPAALEANTQPESKQAHSEEAATWCEQSSCGLSHVLIVEWLTLRTKSFYSPINILATVSGEFCTVTLIILLIFRPIPTQNELVVQVTFPVELTVSSC